MQIIKVDVKRKTRKVWYDNESQPSEPIFVPRPNSQIEDDGVILSQLTYDDFENRVDLLILCAKSLTELGRCSFETTSQVPFTFHGLFVK